MADPEGDAQLARLLRRHALPRGRGDLALDGKELHAAVPKERWCVSREDLWRFRSSVCEALKLGLIVPTDLDPFEESFGPNVYTVTDQFIKRASRLHGNASWALMCNPEGLPCDLFVTHAWVEGIFELADKVLFSWPWRGARSAYICMLSNPQNLDISELIASPEQSPFALALQSAKTMVVVPNHVQSVYNRLWCAYEAHLAIESQLPIRIAPVRRVGHARLKAAAACFVMAALGAVAGRLLLCADVADFLPDNQAFMSVAATLLLLSQVLSEDSVCLFCNYVGVVTVSFFSFFGDMSIVSIGCWAIYILYYLVAERDRVARKETRKSAQQLAKGFHGSVRLADCSSEHDRKSIMNAIAGKVSDVDASIRVLQRAGMSTPILRQAANEGVDVQNAGTEEFSYLVLKYTSTIWYAMNAWELGGPCHVLGALTLLLLSVWTTLFFCFTPERRARHLKIASKIFSVALPSLLLLRIVMKTPFVPLTSMPMAVAVGCVLVLFQSFAVTLSFMGVLRVARIFGPKFACLLVSRFEFSSQFSRKVSEELAPAFGFDDSEASLAVPFLRRGLGKR